MENKEIYIDGVDVTKCPSYMDFKKCTMLSYVSACEGSCAYTGFHNLLVENEEIKKQLKAKEQECERLGKNSVGFARKCQNLELDVCHLKDKNYNLQRQLDQLKAENEELKTAKEILKEKFEIAIKNNMNKTLLRLKNGDIQEELQEIREQFGIETLYFHDDNTRVHRCLDVLRLKNVLAEIKEIAEDVIKNVSDRCIETTPMYGVHKQILRKISEVEDES